MIYILPFRFIKVIIQNEVFLEGSFPLSQERPARKEPSHSKFYGLLETSFTAAYDGVDSSGTRPYYVFLQKSLHENW